MIDSSAEEKTRDDVSEGLCGGAFGVVCVATGCRGGTKAVDSIRKTSERIGAAR